MLVESSRPPHRTLRFEEAKQEDHPGQWYLLARPYCRGLCDPFGIGDFFHGLLTGGGVPIGSGLTTG